MGRSDYKRFVTSCAAGINQNAEEAGQDECADARNVWAPNGKVTQRPGYVGVGVAKSAIELEALTGGVVIRETPLGTFSDTTLLDALPANSRWYYGFTALPAADYPLGVHFNASTPNVLSMAALIEYYNGSEWVRLRAVEADFTLAEALSGLSSTHLESPNEVTIFFPFPADWATTTINANTAYFLRFTLKAINGSTVLTAGTQIASTIRAMYVEPTPGLRDWIVSAKLPSATRFVSNLVTAGTNDVTNAAQLAGPMPGELDFNNSVLVEGNDEPPSVVPVAGPGIPEELYIAYGRRVTLHKVSASKASDVSSLAKVETADFAVGTGAPFSKDYIAQRSDFPAAKYLLFAANRFWYATDTSVGWSAAAPYHKVFPLLSEEGITGAGVVTGLAELGEQVVVFTASSIWVMVARGVNAFGLTEYIPIRRVSGTGCVSNASIKQIRGELVFLGRDGLYAFNGMSVRKLSEHNGTERLETFFGSVTAGRLNRAVALDWTTKSHYLLALSANGAAANNHVLVYDYDKKVFWIWDSIEAVGWLEANGSIYFHDLAARVFEFGKGHTDHGATIESYVITQRPGYGQRRKIETHEIAVWANNMAREVDVDLLPDDADSFKPGTISLRDPVEKDDSVLVVNVDKWHTEKMRMKHIGYHVTCNHAQVKVSHDQKNKPFSLAAIDLGYTLGAAR